ncbi:MAG: hypothetical protein WCA81_09810 [Rhizomicrobium sp.]
MRLPVGALIVIVSIAMTPVTADATNVNTLSPVDQAQLVSTAVKLREAILHVDPKSVVSLISSSDGLICTDTQYNKAQVRKYLSNVNSILYQGLFNAARFSRRCGAGYPRETPATSEKAFFETTPNGSIEIKLVSGAYATVKFVSPKAAYYPREYTFKKEGTNWTLVEGFIIGSCTCG